MADKRRLNYLDFFRRLVLSGRRSKKGQVLGNIPTTAQVLAGLDGGYAQKVKSQGDSFVNNLKKKRL